MSFIPSSVNNVLRSQGPGETDYYQPYGGTIDSQTLYTTHNNLTTTSDLQTNHPDQMASCISDAISY